MRSFIKCTLTQYLAHSRHSRYGFYDSFLATCVSFLPIHSASIYGAPTPQGHCSGGGHWPWSSLYPERDSRTERLDCKLRCFRFSFEGWWDFFKTNFPDGFSLLKIYLEKGHSFYFLFKLLFLFLLLCLFKYTVALKISPFHSIIPPK